MISTDNMQSLKGLMVKQERLRLWSDIKLLWRDEIVQNIGVWPEQIKLAIPIHIQLNVISGQTKELLQLILFIL